MKLIFFFTFFKYISAVRSFCGVFSSINSTCAREKGKKNVFYFLYILDIISKSTHYPALLYVFPSYFLSSSERLESWILRWWSLRQKWNWSLSYGLATGQLFCLNNNLYFLNIFSTRHLWLVQFNLILFALCLNFITVT